MSTTQVYDRWHLARPTPEQRGNLARCEHSTKTRKLYPAASHGTGKQWQVRYRDNDGRQRKEHFHRKIDAQKRAAAVQADMDRGHYVDPQAGKTTVETITREFMEAALHKPQTAQNPEKAFRIHVNPILGRRTVASLKPSDIEKWVADRSKVLAPSTLKTYFGYLKAALQRAVRDGLIARNPCDGVRTPTVRTAEIRPLHPLVVHALVQASPDRYRTPVLTAAGSGLRFGELFGLELEHIDLQRGEIHVRQALVELDKGKPFIGPTKTHESVRTVHLAPFVVAAIKAHLEAFPPVPVMIWDHTDPRKPVERKANLVFLTGNNQPIRRGGWRPVWTGTVKRAKKELARSGAELQVPARTGIHALRHFYASLLIAHGESVKVVQRALGHTKPSMTLDKYVHLWDAVEDTTREAVTQGLGFMQSAPIVPSQLAQAA
ncbi:tyrosine-type recombinase/integrase [Streptomyces sp. NPDC057798]|uniref:tyrosine-type recombinase/integrase n=1 Tax=Streptomyces sp. NPDC057798 TaxID=3346252 RepID=UPI0036B4EB6D